MTFMGLIILNLSCIKNGGQHEQQSIETDIGYGKWA